MDLHQTYLKDCNCTNAGIIIKNDIAYCRWCCVPYGMGGQISYPKERFEENSEYKVLSFQNIDEIKSVKRLRDGEIFSIGDKIKGHPKPICEFIVGGSPNNPRRIEGSLWLLTDMGKTYGCEISSAEKKKDKSTKKPPIGLMPMQIHRENRLEEINAAISRYIEANMVIPTEWICERETIISWLQIK